MQEKRAAIYAPHNIASKFYDPPTTALALELAKSAGYDHASAVTGRFSDDSPLLLSPASIEHVLMLMWLTGDNWESVLLELITSKAMTQARLEVFQANVARLGAFFPYIETRQDQPTLKDVPESVDPEGGKALVIRQADQVAILGELMKHLSYIVTFDIHSKRAFDTLQKEGELTVLNLSAYRQFADLLLSEGTISKGDKNVVVMTSDLGSLPRSHALAEYLEVPIAIVHKQSESKQQGTDRVVTQELVHGSVIGKTVLIFDDMISSGDTSKGVCELALSLGAKEVIFFATHPIFVKDYYNTIKEMMINPQIRVIVGNTMPLTTNGDMSAVRVKRKVDVPYITLPEDEESERLSYMEILDLRPYMMAIILELLASENFSDAQARLAEHLLEPVDPYDLYETITGFKIDKPRITHVYLSQDKYIPIEEYNTHSKT